MPDRLMTPAARELRWEYVCPMTHRKVGLLVSVEPLCSFNGPSAELP